MPYLNQKNVIFVIKRLRSFLGLIIFLFLFCSCYFINPQITYADSKGIEISEESVLNRSLESLRDLDYQNWQLIVYPSSYLSKSLTLRIVGYPGALRLDHPTNLIVLSGRKSWNLQDITINHKNSIGVINDSTAEFDLSPLINQLDKNRPLRVFLPGVINDLSIPPYLVNEWRSLNKENHV